jgi:predicted Holliday junction resolvase-like endonuclease
LLIELAIGFLVLLVFGLILYILCQRRMQKIRFEQWKTFETKRIRTEALTQSRAVLKGKIGEQMAPLLMTFPFHPADARFIGSPIDYIIFVGYSHNMPQEVVLVDIKTGKADITPLQRRIRDLVRQGKVRWQTITI